MNKRYKVKYLEHIGMLHLQDVPGFEWIYIHPGNTDDHTNGCILPGYGLDSEHEHKTSKSVRAYEALYTVIKLAVMHGGERVFITVEDLKC